MVQKKKTSGKKTQVRVVKSEHRKLDIDINELPSDEYTLIRQPRTNSHCLILSVINAIDNLHKTAFTQSNDPYDYSHILNYIKARPKHVIRNKDGSINEELQLTNNLPYGILCEDIIGYVRDELIPKGIAQSWECKSTQLSILDFISPPQNKFKHGDTFIVIGDSTSNDEYRNNATSQYMKAFQSAEQQFLDRKKKDKSFMGFLRTSIYKLQNMQSVIRNGSMARKSRGNSESNFTLHAACVKFVDSNDGNGPLAYLFDPAMQVTKCLTVVHRLNTAKDLRHDTALFHESVQKFTKSIVETYHINSFRIDF